MITSALPFFCAAAKCGYLLGLWGGHHVEKNTASIFSEAAAKAVSVFQLSGLTTKEPGNTVGAKRSTPAASDRLLYVIKQPVSLAFSLIFIKGGFLQYPMV